MNGCVIKNSPIAVDFWIVRKLPAHIRFFFLSHAHGDHTSGLRSSWSNKIYCSATTAKIVRHKYDIDEKYLHPLSVGESHIIRINDKPIETMTVSLIDANHCPGAVMFLFDAYFGRVLYTGDFRYTEAMFGVDSPLSSSPQIDTLYLDNTYNDIKCKFPKRSVAKREVLKLVNEHSNSRRVIAMNDIGKEDLIEEIAKQTNERIHIAAHRYELYQAIDLPDIFTIDEFYHCVSLVPKWKVSVKAIENWNREQRTIVIYPTALFEGLDCNLFSKCSEFVHIVAFSDHSSYDELHQFVQRVKPKEIIPIVNYEKSVYGVDCRQRANTDCFKQYLDPRPQREFFTPAFMYEPQVRISVQQQNTKKTLMKVKMRGKRRSHPPKGIVYGTPEKIPQTCLTVSINTPDKVPVVLDHESVADRHITPPPRVKVNIQTFFKGSKIDRIKSVNDDNFMDPAESKAPTLISKIDELVPFIVSEPTIIKHYESLCLLRK
ncbi:5' exonuclease Apollo-like [Tubulanus polymorphus]|uniref:5' exonuclease Apollo-like n=1 Tax=Tubulanus polymorphus TaxID=672921 RepID=UPI003DA609DF